MKICYVRYTFKNTRENSKCLGLIVWMIIIRSFSDSNEHTRGVTFAKILVSRMCIISATYESRPDLVFFIIS